MSIVQAKLLPVPSAAGLYSRPVTAVFDYDFYIEEYDRTAGIRVVPFAMPEGLSPSETVEVAGVLSVIDGERCLWSAAVLRLGYRAVKPVGLTLKALGGGDWLFNPATYAGQQGVAGACGLNNIGLLVRVCGTVTWVDADNHLYYLDDGSGVDDGSGHSGVRVITWGQLPVQWSAVAVTGVSSCYHSGPDLHRLLRQRY